MKELAEICAEVENSLPLFVGGDLEADAMAEIEGHIAACASCAARAAEARRARAALVSALKLHASGPALWSGVRAVLAEDGLFGPSTLPTSVVPGAPAASRAARADLAREGTTAAASRAHTTPILPIAPISPVARERRLRLLPFGVAAAAALVFGVWLGSRFFGTNSTSVEPGRAGVAPLLVKSTPPSGTNTQTPAPSRTVDPDAGAALASGGEPTDNAVASNDSLRRLAPNEPRLRRGALYFDPADDRPEGSMNAGSPFDLNTPVGLRRVSRGP